MLVPKEVRKDAEYCKNSFESNYNGSEACIVSPIRVNNNAAEGSASGGSQFIHIPNIGKRKIRYYKNGKPYVLVKGKKVKI